MDVFFLQWLALLSVFALGLISPGPDFVIAVKNSVLHSRRTGVFTALGFALGVLVHVSYSILGIAALISQSILLFSVIKYIGAAYLIYLGVKSLRSKGLQKGEVSKCIKNAEHEGSSLSTMSAIRSGFFTNLLNPKATLFFLAIFTQIISPETPVLWKAIYGASCSVMTAIWFSIVAYVLTHRSIRHSFLAASQWIDRICGVFLIAFGLKVALSSQ
jgi:RhtB (resistance to homoserine/threonine) family protein